MIVEAAAAVILLLFFLCLISSRFQITLIHFAFWLKLASKILSSTLRHWKLVAALAAFPASSYALMVAYGFELEALPLLHPLTPLLASLSWLLHGSLTAIITAGVVWLLHGPFNPALVLSSSLLVGVAVWMLLHSAWRPAGAALASSIALLAIPHAASHQLNLPAPPSILVAVALCSSVFLSAVLAARLYVERGLVCESFYASYVSPLASSGGRAAGGVRENGEVRIVMLAVADGDKIHVLVSGCVGEEFEDKARLIGGFEGLSVVVSRQVKRAWRSYLSKGDPQLAVSLLLKMLESAAGGRRAGSSSYAAWRARPS